mmetsp:Transcript_28552/g.50742  ORF Transcript_28552/g.50742 Transcript_28552/m.50742 type:complete len:408 (-) Transcript_28552:23-1246(-)
MESLEAWPRCYPEELTFLAYAKFNIIYTLGYLCDHAYSTSLALIIIAFLLRPRPINLSSALIGVFYALDECLRFKSTMKCCSFVYYHDLGEQVLRLIPPYTIGIFVAFTYISEIIYPYYYSRTGQLAAFWQIFPSYLLTFFMLMHQYFVLSAWVAGLLIGIVTSSRPNSFLITSLRSQLGHTAVFFAATCVNFMFICLDCCVRSPFDMWKFFALRQLWCMLACVEFEIICFEADFLKELKSHRSEQKLISMLKRSVEDPFFIMLPIVRRKRVYSRLFSIFSQYYNYLSEETLVEMLDICLSQGVNPNYKSSSKAHVLEYIFYNFKPRVLILLDRYHFDYTIKLANGKSFLEMAISVKDTSENNAAIYSYVRRKLTDCSFILFAHKTKHLKGLNKLNPYVMAESLKFL